jgi:hypothetical protein
MFANLPGILGFYPEKSIVLAGFHRSESTQQPGKYVLGPLFRTDSNRTDAIADILRNLTMSTDLIFGFIIDNGIYSDSNSAPCAQDYVRSLCAIARDHDAPLAAVWATPSLYTGEPYRRVFGLTQHDVGPATTGRDNWDAGCIAPVASAASTRDLLSKGMLPDITRTDMLDHFQPIHAFDDDIEAHVVQKQIAEMAQSLADLAEAHTPESSGTFAAAMDELWEVLAAVRDTINDCDAEVIANCDLAEAIAADTELLINGAVFFAHPLLRDVALVAADRSVNDSIAPGTTRAFMELALAVGRCFTGELRANALCSYALAASQCGYRVRTVPAVRCALEAKSDHGLADLLMKGFYAGLCDQMLKACLAGSVTLREKYTHPAQRAEGAA